MVRPQSPQRWIVFLLVVTGLICSAASVVAFTPVLSGRRAGSVVKVRAAAHHHHDEEKAPAALSDRRLALRQASAVVAATTAWGLPRSANAGLNDKDRTEGYPVQHTEREWAYMLSGPQYNILRQGGTERPNTSILEGEDREGTYRCAGCNTLLFTSAAKFHSGTGWPSFATSEPGVEVQSVGPIQASLLGAEIRCATCGGHLGDLFNDGILFVNTPAFASGKRFCVDGGALIFRPSGGTSADDDVYGDLAPPVTQKELPSFLAPPKINARDA